MIEDHHGDGLDWQFRQLRLSSAHRRGIPECGDSTDDETHKGFRRY
jgi:hypothetical protein